MKVLDHFAILLAFIIVFNGVKCSLCDWFECGSSANGHRKLHKLYTKINGPISVLGAPFWRGQRISGTDKAPEWFRAQNIIKQIKRLGYENVIDYGNIQFRDNPKDKTFKTRNSFSEIHNQYTLSDGNRLIDDRIRQILAKGETLVLLGGDHSITAGAILGNAKLNPDVCVIYVDAHGDLNNCESTTSGNLHGMSRPLLTQSFYQSIECQKECPSHS